LTQYFEVWTFESISFMWVRDFFY